MKNITLIIITSFALVTGYFIGARHQSNKDWADRYKYTNEKIAMGEFYRKITGFDSIQIYNFGFDNKLNVNFCNPNQWEFEKWKILDSSGELKIGIQKGDILSGKSIKNVYK